MNLEYTINMMLRDCRFARLPFTVYSMSATTSDSVDPRGQHGHSGWNDTVDIYRLVFDPKDFPG